LSEGRRVEDGERRREKILEARREDLATPKLHGESEWELEEPRGSTGKLAFSGETA